MNHSYTASWLTNGTEKSLSLANGACIRYVVAGTGPALVLLHTLRTQLDAFQKLIPLLSQDFTVYALDLPGLGYSSLPADSLPTEPFFRQSVQQFMIALRLQDVTLVGESIGGTLALTVAAEAPKHVRAAYAINPYDYGDNFGGGIRRSRFGTIIGLFGIFRQFTPEAYPFLWLVMSGGVEHRSSLPKGYVPELYRSGRQKGYRRNEYLIFKNWRSWKLAKELYQRVAVPVSLIYGSGDWSLKAERAEHKTLLPHASFYELAGVSHFATLEQPTAIAKIITKGKIV